MRPSNAVIWLSALVVVLALVAAAVGLFWQDGGSPFAVTTLRGETVQIYGQGLYRYESLRNGVGFKGVDLFILVVGIPLLLLFIQLYRRGSLRGGVLLTGTLAYFLYNATHLTFGYAYNTLFLVYLTQFSASLFATMLAFRSIDAQTLPAHSSEKLPRRSIAGFLFVVGLSLIIVWIGLSILPALLQGRAPQLSGSTTLVTHAVDVGIIAPLALLAGVLLLRRAALGYLLAAALLVLSSVLGAGVVALSAAQVLAGALTTTETIMFVVPFVILTVAGIWLTVLLFRNLSEPVPLQVATVQPAHPETSTPI
jgi:hypothetical protein